MSSEIGASATYLMLSQHLKGSSKKLVEQIMRDEIKHLAIFGSAYQYLTGNDPVAVIKRRIGNYKTFLEFAMRHTDAEYGRSSFDQPIPAAIGLQLLAAVHEIELQVQLRLKQMPLISMADVFDGPIARPEAEFKYTELEQAQLNFKRAVAAMERLSLKGWSQKNRVENLRALNLISNSKDGLLGLIATTRLSEVYRLKKSISFNKLKALVDEQINTKSVAPFLNSRRINRDNPLESSNALIKKSYNTLLESVAALLVAEGKLSPDASREQQLTVAYSDERFVKVRDAVRSRLDLGSSSATITEVRHAVMQIMQQRQLDIPGVE